MSDGGQPVSETHHIGGVELSKWIFVKSWVLAGQTGAEKCPASQASAWEFTPSLPLLTAHTLRPQLFPLGAEVAQDY